jgi:2-methylisocitrate lyase-like PEP mutase family enzyme
MALTVQQKRAAFRALHVDGCFVLPNPWDVGSARRLERMGFNALASTSSGFAWSMGREDGDMSRDEVLTHLTMLSAATDLPVNADFESGFAEDAAGVAANVALAVKTGVAGLSIEDRVGRELYETELAVERIQAARRSIDTSGEDVLLVGRYEGFLIGQTDGEVAIRRLVAYAEAGADCLYAPGIKAIGAIRELVAAVQPKPVNVLLMNPEMRVAELAAAGVRRVSVGGALAAAAWKGFDHAAKLLRDEGWMPPRN